MDLDESEIPPPGNVAVAGVVYEVTTTATYEGLITLCFSYAGIDFGEATPRLFHYENNAWVDITTSVDPSTADDLWRHHDAVTLCRPGVERRPHRVLRANESDGGIPQHREGRFNGTAEVRRISQRRRTDDDSRPGDDSAGDCLRCECPRGCSRASGGHGRNEPPVRRGRRPLHPELEGPEDTGLLHGSHDDAAGRPGAHGQVQSEVMRRDTPVMCAQPLEHVAPLHLLTTMVVPLLSPSGSWFF